jgi:hypothetical protein
LPRAIEVNWRLRDPPANRFGAPPEMGGVKPGSLLLFCEADHGKNDDQNGEHEKHK